MNIKDYNLTFPNGTNNKNNPKYIIIHHDVWPGATMVDIHNDHIKNKGYNGTGYHFRVRFDGTVEKGRPVFMSGAHCKQEHMNFQSIGVVFEGCYSDWPGVKTTTKMPEIQFLRGVELIKQLMKDYNISYQNIRPHNYYANKECPGKYFPMVELLSEVIKVNKHWGEDAIRWMREIELINSNHNPEDTLTWAEFATVIKRLYLRRNE